MVIPRLLLALSPLLLCPLGCNPGVSAAPSAPPVPKGIESVKLVIPEGNPWTPAKADLGKTLFFDQRLAKDGSMACQTCHLHEKAWTDGLALSPKVGGVNTRNTPSLYNVAYQPYYYWDGRAATLELNIEAAWKNQMGGDPATVAKQLAEIPAYSAAFQSAFAAPPSAASIVQALAAFVRTLQSGDSPYDRGTLSEAAKRGQVVFTARCIPCHVPPLFTDSLFHNIGVGDATKDTGRLAREPENKARTGAFKTPGLRGAARSAPYFHDGSVATLRDAVALMAKGGNDNEFLDPILQGLRAPPLPTEQDIDDLVEFIKALDSSEPFTPPKLP